MPPVFLARTLTPALSRSLAGEGVISGQSFYLILDDLSNAPLTSLEPSFYAQGLHNIAQQLPGLLSQDMVVIWASAIAKSITGVDNS